MCFLGLSLTAILVSAIGAAGAVVEDDWDLLQASASRNLLFSDLSFSTSISNSDRRSRRSLLLSPAYSDSEASAGDFLLGRCRGPSLGDILRFTICNHKMYRLVIRYA